MKARPWLIGLFLIALLAGSEGFRLWWFQKTVTESNRESALAWRPPPGAAEIDLSSSRASEVLRYDLGHQFRLEDPARGLLTEVTYLEYEPGNARVLPDLYLHSPEICLPRSGVKLVAEIPPKRFNVPGRELLIRRWIFELPGSGKIIHAFKTIWSGDDHLMQETLYSRDLQEARLQAARDGRQFAGGRMVLAVTIGLEDEEVAWDDFKARTLSQLKLEGESEP